MSNIIVIPKSKWQKAGRQWAYPRWQSQQQLAEEKKQKLNKRQAHNELVLKAYRIK